MEKNIMKLRSLTIKNLYGYINYNIKFNDNITFLYGDNGCGKTTILNLITYIITARIYKLFDYSFDEIILAFQSSKSQRVEKIEITPTENKNLIVKLSSNEIIIGPYKEYINSISEEAEDLEHFYLSHYPLLEEIKNIFNYIYLPLDRNSSLNNDDPYFYRTRRIVQRKFNRFKNTDKNFASSLFEVQSLVSSAFNKLNTTLNLINEKFSDDILKSFLDTDNIISTDTLIKSILSLDAETVQKTKTDYIAVLKSLNKWDNSSNKKIDDFFESLINDIRQLKHNNHTSLEVTFLFKLSEVDKINKIIDKAREAEKSKKDAMRPVENFLNTVNKFIHNDINYKEIYINDEGFLFLKTEGNKEISIHSMSSGEKQIVTFFANLILGFEKSNQSIFIVDEPELSLHLSWQRQFINAIMSVNKNVQLIFATHSPEIIGKHRDKAIKLTPSVKERGENA